MSSLRLLPRALPILAVLSVAQTSWAICDVIPGAVQAKRSALGSVDRPYAAPDEFVQITPAPLFCTRVESFPPDPQVVTIVFAPPHGSGNAVVIANDCAALATQLAACDTELGAGTVSCIDADDPGDPANPRLLQSSEAISFRFPDTDARVDAADDDRTLSGPARIAVVPATASSLRCGELASSGCSDTTGMTACIDKFYDLDGTCQTDRLDPTFPSFTALPPWNDYSKMCSSGIGACSGTDPEVRFTIDSAGNALIPVDWRGMLVRVEDTPFPRLVDGDTTFPAFDGSPNPVRVPPSMVASYAPNGIKVPPLFTPLSGKEEVSSDPLQLFGSVDAPLGVMRVARRSRTFQECSGGDVAGSPCNDSNDCSGGGSCGPTTCRGGIHDGSACTSDGDCDGGECGPSLFAFDERFSGSGTGPVLISNTQYAARAGTTVQIDALIDTDNTLAFPVRESIENQDLNGDSDASDTVVFVGEADQGIASGGESAVTVVHEPPFRYAALAAEGDVVAYPEPEAHQGPCGDGLGTCDQNGDGDIGDTLLRALRVTGTSAAPVSGSLGNVCIDPSPIVAGRSLAVSDGLVFVRADEPGCADQEQTNLGPGTPGDYVEDPTLSRDGDVAAYRESDPAFYDSDAVAAERATGTVERLDGSPDLQGVSFNLRIDASGDRVVFSTDLDLTGDGVSPKGVYAYGRASDTVTLVSRDTDQTPIAGDFPYMSRNGRFVVFATDHHDRLLLRDLQEGTTAVVMTTSDPFFVAQCGGATYCDLDWGQPSDDGTVVYWSARIGNVDVIPSHGFVTDLAKGMSEAPGFPSFNSDMSADGRFLAFTSADPLAAGDTNSAADVYVLDRRTGALERASVGTNGEQSPSASYLYGFSADGRRVLFESAASNLVPNDTGGFHDFFVHDRLTGITERVSLSNADGQFASNVLTASDAPLRLSPEGRAVAFQLEAEGDLIRIRTFDPHDAGADVNGDGDSRDVVLAVLDTHEADPTLQGLGASGQADVAGGNAAFLRGGDADPNGGTVTLYRDRSGTSDLGRFASQVALSDEWVGALVSEAVEGNLNGASGDTDTADHVVEMNDVATGTAASWVNSGQAADALDVAGPIAVFTTPESAQNDAHLNPDGDSSDRVLQLFDAEKGLPDGLKTIPYAVKDFVLGDFRRVCVENTGDACTIDADCPDNALCHDDGTCRAVSTLCSDDADCSGGATCEPDLIVAFRASEADQEENLNGLDQNPDTPPGEEDMDQDDDVLMAYDLLLDKVVNSGQAVTPCLLQACDPRAPYRVVGETVRFLTYEGDQGVGQDLNNNGALDDLLVQILSVRTRKVRVVGALAADATAPVGEDQTPVDPLTPLQDPGPGQGDNEAFVGRGQCVDSLAGVLQGTCVTDADCPGDATCEPNVITVASADEDGDAIPDAIDNCPSVFNPGQADADHDGQGDACDLQTCGNGVRELDENCDDGNLVDGDGCSSFCSAPEPPIELDVQPGMSPNVINLKKSGVISVVVFGSEDVDVSLLDPATLVFGPAHAPLADPGDPHIGNFNGSDGYPDAKLHFDVQESGLQPGDSEACLEGELDGIFFHACAPVDVVSGRMHCGLGFELAFVLPCLQVLRRRRGRRRAASRRTGEGES